jgi:hypothetical protein
MFPHSIRLLLLFMLLVSGCAARSQPAPVIDPGCSDAKRVHIVIGLSGHETPVASRQRAVRELLAQAQGLIRPGSRGLMLSAYFSDKSVTAEPLRLKIGCLPESPQPPGLVQAPTLRRADTLKAYRAA